MSNYVFIALAITTMVANAADCNPPPNPPTPDAADAAPPAPDAGPSPNATAYQAACATLASLACAEGVDSTCAATLEHATTMRFTTFDLPCLTSAKTKAAVRECKPKNVACP